MAAFGGHTWGQEGLPDIVYLDVILVKASHKHRILHTLAECDARLQIGPFKGCTCRHSGPWIVSCGWRRLIRRQPFPWKQADTINLESAPPGKDGKKSQGRGTPPHTKGLEAPRWGGEEGGFLEGSFSRKPRLPSSKEEKMAPETKGGALLSSWSSVLG